MATKPDKFPEWVNDNPTDPDSGQLARVAPPQSKKDSGWSREEIPPRQWLNWLAWKTNQWIVWLEDRVENLLSRMGPIEVRVDDAEVDISNHIGETDAHGATADATVSSIMMRKSDGRGGDIEPGTANKDPLSFVQAQFLPVNDAIMKRDPSGRGARVNDAVTTDGTPALRQIGLGRAVSTDWIAGSDFSNGVIDITHGFNVLADWPIKIMMQIKIDAETGGYSVGDLISDVWSGAGNMRATAAVRISSDVMRVVNDGGIEIPTKGGGSSLTLSPANYSVRFFVFAAVSSPETATHTVVV